MKIGLSFPGCHRRGGVERVVFECAQFLSLRGHEVSVLANECETIRNVHHLPILPGIEPSFLKGAGYFRRSRLKASTMDLNAQRFLPDLIAQMAELLAIHDNVARMANYVAQMSQLHVIRDNQHTIPVCLPNSNGDGADTLSITFSIK
jgi:hypothetical protein